MAVVADQDPTTPEEVVAEVTAEAVAEVTAETREMTEEVKEKTGAVMAKIAMVDVADGNITKI